MHSALRRKLITAFKDNGTAATDLTRPIDVRRVFPNFRKQKAVRSKC